MLVIKWQRENPDPDGPNPHPICTSPRLFTAKRANYLVKMANEYFSAAEHWAEKAQDYHGREVIE